MTTNNYDELTRRITERAEEFYRDSKDDEYYYEFYTHNGKELRKSCPINKTQTERLHSVGGSECCAFCCDEEKSVSELLIIGNNEMWFAVNCCCCKECYAAEYDEDGGEVNSSSVMTDKKETVKVVLQDVIRKDTGEKVAIGILFQ